VVHGGGYGVGGFLVVGGGGGGVVGGALRVCVVPVWGVLGGGGAGGGVEMRLVVHRGGRVNFLSLRRERGKKGFFNLGLPGGVLYVDSPPSLSRKGGRDAPMSQ